MPQHCVSIPVRLPSSLPFCHRHRLLCSRPCRLLISNSAWSAGCRQTGAEREDAVFVCRCLPLLQSKWKRPVGSSVCVYLSLSEEGSKAWKCCPQAACVFGWRSASDRSRRSNVAYDSLPCRFILGKLKPSCSLAFDLSYVSTSRWICVWQGQTGTWTDADDHLGTEAGMFLCRENEVCEGTRDSACFAVYLSFGTSYALRPTSQSSVNAINLPAQSYCRSQALQRILSLLACRFPTQSHLISLTQLPMNTLLVATSSSIKFKRML